MVLLIYSGEVSFAMTCSLLTLVYKGACDWPSIYGSGLEAYVDSNQLQILSTLQMKNETNGGGRGGEQCSHLILSHKQNS